MANLVTGLDVLGLGMLIGSLLLLGGLVWVLVENRSFDEPNRSTSGGADGPDATVLPARPAQRVILPAETTEDSPEPRQPSRPRHAA